MQRPRDLAICSRVPRGIRRRSTDARALRRDGAPDHPLHRLGRELTLQDLRQHRQS